MKKIKRIFIFLCLLSITSCGISFSNEGKYFLNVTSDESCEEYIQSKPKSNFYLPGEIINFKISILYDTEVYVFLNSEKVLPYDRGENFNQFSIKMPSQDS